METLTNPLTHVVHYGGWVVIAIAGIFMMAWCMIAREWLKLRERTAGGWTAIQTAVRQLDRSPPDRLPAATAASPNVIARLLQSELIGRKIDRSSFETQVMPLLQSEAATFARTQRTVNVLAGCMPLLGLLGTVFGMIDTFIVLTAQGIADVDDLASGISKALITTQAGLVMSLPVLLTNSYLAARIRSYLDTATVMLKKIETAICDEQQES